MSYLLGCECDTKVGECLSMYENMSPSEKVDFWRGYFDTNGTITKNPSQDVKVNLVVKDTNLLEAFKTFVNVGICFETDTYDCVFWGTNAIEFIAQLYRHNVPEVTSNYIKYKQLMHCWTPTHTSQEDVTFKYQKTRPDAIAPQKAHVTDTGFDLWLLEKVKEENGMVMYDTGIIVKPPHGYYFELVGRSSISKSGYIMANSVGIIDSSYRGSLKVALIKVNKDMPDLEMPCRLVQLIPRQFLHLEAEEVEELELTARGDGGFGSSTL